jgi:hypothetical protein
MLKRQGIHNIRNITGWVGCNKRREKNKNRKRKECAELMCDCK